MPYIGAAPVFKPISGSDIVDGTVSSAELATGSVTIDKIPASANVVFTHRSNQFSNAQYGTIKDLGVRSSNVSLVLSDSNYYSMVVNGNLTVLNPTGLNVGQAGSLVFTSNGSFTVSFGNQWRFPGGTAPTLSTVAGKIDRVDYLVQTSNTIHSVATIDLLGT